MSERLIYKSIWIGTQNVDLYVDDKHNGGSFNNDKILIGLNYPHWANVVAVTLHEALEYATAAMNCRFTPCNDHSGAADAHIMVMTHSQFSEIAARASRFVAIALPLLATEYNKLNSKKKK